MYYAQIANGVVVAVTETHAAIDAADMVAIASLDASLLGQSYADGVFTPAPPQNNVSAVSPRQIRQALTLAGLRAGVEAAVAAGDQDLKDWYGFATEFHRTNPNVISMGVVLGVSDSQLDELWALAGSL